MCYQLVDKKYEGLTYIIHNAIFCSLLEVKDILHKVGVAANGDL